MAKSDGGSTSYYQFPYGFTDLQDLIEHKNMSFGRANIFKAAYRLGDKDDVSEEYDLRKIIWFAQRRLAELAAKKHVGTYLHEYHLTNAPYTSSRIIRDSDD